MKIEEGHLKGLRRGLRSKDRYNQDRDYTHMKLKKIKNIFEEYTTNDSYIQKF